MNSYIKVYTDIYMHIFVFIYIYIYIYKYECNIMAKGFRFMPLGLVRLRTFRLSAWVT